MPVVPLNERTDKRSPQAAYQARRRAKTPQVIFFPSDKAALNRAVQASGLTQLAWLVAVVDLAIEEQQRRRIAIQPIPVPAPDRGSTPYQAATDSQWRQFIMAIHPAP